MPAGPPAAFNTYQMEEDTGIEPVSPFLSGGLAPLPHLAAHLPILYFPEPA